MLLRQRRRDKERREGGEETRKGGREGAGRKGQ